MGRWFIRLVTWSCSLLAAVLSVAWIASELYPVSYHGGSGAALLSRGVTGVTRYDWADWNDAVMVSVGILDDTNWWRSHIDIDNAQRQSLWRIGWVRHPVLCWTIVVPLWMPIALLAAIACGARGFTRRMRRRAGVCVQCAYSRDGLPASAPCPECGTVLASGVVDEPTP